MVDKVGSTGGAAAAWITICPCWQHFGITREGDKPEPGGPIAAHRDMISAHNSALMDS
jgi:hypothetical protein